MRDAIRRHDDSPPSRLSFGAIFKIFLLLCAVVAGILIYVKVTTLTPKSLSGNQLYVMTHKRVNNGGAMGMMDIVKHDFYPIIYSKANFFYRDAACKSVSLRSAGHELYEGTLCFVRNRKNMQRPIHIDRQASFTNYHFPFKYAEKPEYLEEDGDLVFALATQVDKKLQGWKYVSGKVMEKNILSCVISKDGTEKTIRLKAEQVSCDDNIGRIWVEVLK
jgi:hypothetical protein